MESRIILHERYTFPFDSICYQYGRIIIIVDIVNKTNYNLLQDSLNIDDLVDP